MISPTRSLTVVVALSLAAGACASPSWRDALASAEDASPEARAALVLIAGKDPTRAADLAEDVLARAAPDGGPAARALFTLLVASDALGDFERPLPHLLRVLQATTDPQVAARLAPEARRAWARLDGEDARSPALRAALVRVTEMPGEAWEPARARARDELIIAARLSSGRSGARQAAAAAGYLLTWRLSAPWGETPAIDFLTTLGPETRPLADVEETGAGFGLRPVATTEETFSDGEVTFFDLPESGGVGFAEARIGDAAAAAKSVVVRMECNRSCAAFADGVPVVMRTLQTEPWLAVARLDLPPGAHRLTIKLASPDGRGFFRVQLSELASPAVAPDRVRVHALPLAPAPPAPRPGDAGAAVLAILDLEDRLSRPKWDPTGARSLQAALEASFGPHVALDLPAARLALGDAVAPPPERRQIARRRFEAVLAVDPTHAVARRGLARVERDEDRPDRALALLTGDGEAGRAPPPPDARTRLELLDIYRARGWEVEALAVADALGPLAHTSPRVLQELIDVHHGFGRVERALELARELNERFPGAGSERLYDILADRGEIRPELPLAAFQAEPQRHEWLRDAVTGMRRRSELDEAEASIAAFRRARPNDGWALAERVRIALQAGDEGGARARIAEALALEPDFAPLEELDHQLAGEAGPFDAIEDPSALMAIWRTFRAADEGASWAAYPVISLLDRRRIDVRADGSTLELVHRVRLVQTKQGADALGDLRPPEGARLLVARTLKADGRVLEPERTEGKAELSFSELAPGDALETAWVSRSRVSPSEGGYLTGLSFAAWGAPIFRLDAVVTLAPGLEAALTTFAGAPAPTRRESAAGGVELVWRHERLPAIVREPQSVSTRAFFPFVDVHVVRADEPASERNARAWSRIARAYAARVLELGHVGPRLEAIAETMRDQPRPAEAAFGWVKKEVADQEQLNSFETTAEAAVATRKGNRALVLWALLRALGEAPQMLVCAPERDGPPEDRAHPTPNANRFFYPIVATADGLLFDPARPYTPPNDLPRELGGARCLIPPIPARDAAAPPSAPLFRDLPPAPQRPDFKSELDLVVAADGSARGTLVGFAQGAAASPLRQAFLAQDDERRRILFEQWLSSLALGARLVSYETHDAAHGSRPMQWRLEIEIPAFAERDGEALIVRRPLKHLVHSDFAGVAELAQLVSADRRETPLRLLPFSEEVIVRITTPGHAISTPPPDVSSFGLEQTSFSPSPDELVLVRRVLMAPGRVSPDDYLGFRGAVGGFIRTLEAPLRFEPVD